MYIHYGINSTELCQLHAEARRASIHNPYDRAYVDPWVRFRLTVERIRQELMDTEKPVFLLETSHSTRDKLDSFMLEKFALEGSLVIAVTSNMRIDACVCRNRRAQFPDSATRAEMIRRAYPDIDLTVIRLPPTTESLSGKLIDYLRPDYIITDAKVTPKQKEALLKKNGVQVIYIKRKRQKEEMALAA